MEVYQLQPTYKDAPHFQDFWKNGNGKKMKEWSGAHLSFDQFEKFEPYYYRCDDLGDAVVKDVYFKKSFKDASAEIENYIRNGVDAQDSNIPESVKKLFQETQHIPDWVDWELMEMGAGLCRRSGLNSLIVLRDYTLMGGYDNAYLTKPLIFTGALKKGAVKRLADTLNFWVNVTRKYSMKTHQKGYEMAIKTRLIHSYSRLMILEKTKNWDTKNYGLPINTWDMIATYIGFSLVFLHGLKKMDMHITPEEEKGHFMLWKYIGYLIGIPENLLPNNKKEATESFYCWTSIQPSSDKDSVLLAQSLLDENLEATFLKYHFQRKTLRNLHASMNWFLLDKEVNERLQIPKLKFPNAFANMIRFRNRWFQKFNNYEKQLKIGGEAQEKVLDDYLKIAPRNVHG